MKRCRICDELKILDKGFHVDRKSKDGRHGACKICRCLAEQERAAKKENSSSPTENNELMPALVPVSMTYLDEMEKQTVNARELHTFLGVGKDFSTWIRNKLLPEYFLSNRDFIVIHNPESCSPKMGSKTHGGHNKIEYILSLETAKHLAMLQNNEKGHEVREYFIRCK